MPTNEARDIKPNILKMRSDGTESAADNDVGSSTMHTSGEFLNFTEIYVVGMVLFHALLIRKILSYFFLNIVDFFQ